jgi:hypothetical protein
MEGAKTVMRVVNPYTSNTTMTVLLMAYIQRSKTGVGKHHAVRNGRDTKMSNPIVNINIGMGGWALE